MMMNDWADYGPSSRGKYVGLVAQEAIEWAPWTVNAGEAVNCSTCKAGNFCNDHDHIWKAEYDHMVPLLIKSIHQLEDRIKTLENN